jgi:hypothetical protein
MNRRSNLLIVFHALATSLAIVPQTLTGAEPDKWFLLGREGQCAPLSLLTKKSPEFQGIESPAQLAEKMRAAGHKAQIKEYKATSRPSVEVRVPEKNIYLMFVKGDVCSSKKAEKK